MTDLSQGPRRRENPGPGAQGGVRSLLSLPPSHRELLAAFSLSRQCGGVSGAHGFIDVQSIALTRFV